MTPPDAKQCQAEIGGAFMLGPGKMRCQKTPIVIARENKPGPDGQHGSMSLCPECRDALVRVMGKTYATFTVLSVKL